MADFAFNRPRRAPRAYHTGEIQKWRREQERARRYKRLRFLIGLVLAAFLLVALVRQGSAASIEEKIQEHLTWLCARMECPETVELPPIVYLEKEPMQVFYYGDLYFKAKADGTKLLEVRAIYHNEAQVMFLREGYDPEDPVTAPILLHELVHHVQAITGADDKAPCLRWTEKEAYRLQTEWMTEHNSPAEKPDAFTVMLVSTCDMHS